MERPHHYNREPQTGADRTLLTREQEQYAAACIERGLDAAARADTAIDPTTARLIAAATHPGYGSHLEHFAATGALNAAAALEEIGGGAALHQLPWITALWDFLEQIHSPDPDRPPTEWEEPTPAVFVQAKDPELGLLPVGTWVTPANDRIALEEALTNVAERLGVEGATAGITAAVGFHGLVVPFDAAPRTVRLHAESILKHGEPYALLVERVGRPIADEDFLLGYLGAYASLTAFMAILDDDVLRAVRADFRNSAATDQTQHFDEFEQLLRRTFICLDGHDAVYLFQRTPALTAEDA